jgi:putative hydrolase of the HAD superfamily
MIKNIIFDLGNVIIDLDLERSEYELKRILGEDMREKLAAEGHAEIFERFEMGLCSEDEFLSVLQSVGNQQVSFRRLIDAWNAMLIYTPKHRLEMLSGLKSKYNVFLLSNTNETHLRWVHDDLARTHGIHDFETRFFHKPYYSHLVQLRKPNLNIYEFVLQDANLLPEETLFIDDNAANIAAAKSLGIQTIHHAIGAEVVDVLTSYLVKRKILLTSFLYNV